MTELTFSYYYIINVYFNAFSGTFQYAAPNSRKYTEFPAFFPGATAPKLSIELKELVVI
jgi:hypothetical protein